MAVTPFCTDENIALRCQDDFTRLAPEANRLSHGSDGSLSEVDPWLLTSASTDFAALGVAAGHVVWLQNPVGVRGGHLSPSGDILAVSSVSGSTLTTRRIGMDAEMGYPPCPPGGVSGVLFTVKTLAPQIEEVSYEITQKYAMFSWITERAPGELTEARQLRKLCVEMVLRDRYFDMAKQNDANDLWLMKAKQFAAFADETARQIDLRWGPKGESQHPTSAFFGRVSR
jgi:hypothetical protein